MKVTKLQSWQQPFGAQSQGRYAQLILKLLWQKKEEGCDHNSKSVNCSTLVVLTSLNAL